MYRFLRFLTFYLGLYIFFTLAFGMKFDSLTYAFGFLVGGFGPIVSGFVEVEKVKKEN